MKPHQSSLLTSVSLAFAATLLLAAEAAAAQPSAPLDADDARFIQEEAAVGAALVQMAEMAAEKAQRPDVKAFAKSLVEDHTKSNAELESLARRKSVELPTEPIARPGDLLDKLERTGTPEFDREFLTLVAHSHDGCVKRFKAATTEAEDPDLKAWAAKMLPGLQKHLEKAQSLRTAAASGPARPGRRYSTVTL